MYRKNMFCGQLSDLAATASKLSIKELNDFLRPLPKSTPNQIDKLDDWGRKRFSNYLSYQELIKNNYWKPYEELNDFTSNFAYPIIHPNRDEIVQQLELNGVEVRPMICGSMGTQPFYVKRYGRLELPNVSEIDRFCLYVPNLSLIHI